MNVPESLKKIDKDAFGWISSYGFNGIASEHTNLTIYGYRGTIAETYANTYELRFSTGLPSGVPAPRTPETPDPTEKAMKEKAAADERRRIEEERRVAEKKRMAEERARREAEAKRLEEERQAELAAQKLAWQAQLNALNLEKQEVLKTIETNKGIFGEKARRRKEAKQRLTEIYTEIAQLEKWL